MLILNFTRTKSVARLLRFTFLVDIRIVQLSTRILQHFRNILGRGLMAVGPTVLLLLCLSMIGSAVTMDGSLLLGDMAIEVSTETDTDPSEKSEKELDADDEKLQHSAAAMQWLSPVAILRWHHPNAVAHIPIVAPATPPPEQA